MAVIEPQDIEFVINNDDGTSTIGIGYDELVKGEVVRKIRNQVVPRAEGLALEKIMKKRDAEIAKIKKASGNQSPPSFEAPKREARVIVGPNGKPISVADVMKVRKRGS